MAKPKPRELSQEYVRELFIYNPETGMLFWRVNRNRGRAGQIAGYMNDKGYWKVGFDHRSYFVSRIAWTYMKGPTDKEIDHENGDQADNRIDNLREATYEQNSHNRRINCNNSSGFKGVYLTRDKFKNKPWRAVIKANGKSFSLGYFYTAEEAGRAYNEAATRLHGEFSITKRSA